MAEYPRRNGTQLRNAELAQIHLAKKQLALDDDTYRAVLWAVARVKSAKDLDWTGRKTLLEHFKAKGWKPAAPKKAQAAKPAAPGQEGLLRALWADLHAAGKVRVDTDAALSAWLVRNKWPQRAEWLSHAQLTAAIEGLKKWLAR
jgi:hypothetical protein